MARPKIPVNGEEVEKLASFGLTNREIGEMFGASEATIGRRFASETRKGRATLHKSLRRKQTEVALSGNVTMLIWLGKNMLGQADKQDVDNSGEVKHVITIEYIDTATTPAPTSGATDDQATGTAL